ncbi:MULTISPECIES: microcin C ABC transporter permease YejB [Helicobacter]|uniref:Microcin ABC transporter permease n=2 Tax=Helicobacter ganmani TaxID=60246 RepID=A0A3D8IF65_9HELI|nr:MULTISPECIES: microcin C ABC transporter permease YejB [Helicobacter]RDU63635.1 microcin ABC transporter permease [Helicobacter ganmani]
MKQYIFKRLLLIIPTLLGIMTLNFFIIQAAPGGPVEQMIARLEGVGGQGEVQPTSVYKNQGLDEEMIAKINALYGFDKPLLERYILMLKNYLCFEFGSSFYKNTAVIDLLLEKLPVSISLGLWSTLLIYLISIPLGIQKALKEGSTFDSITSTLIIIGNAIPTFLFALILIIFFAGGTYFNLFPLRGIIGDDFANLSLFGKIKDYFWHITLPVISLSIGGFATLTLLSKNSFLEEIHKQYVQLAFAKGLNESQVLYRHIFRNAMLIIIASIPSALLGILLSGSLLIEIIFSLDGLGLLGYESIITRDYPVIFGSLYLFTLFGLIVGLISDLLYTFIDPRINFQRV